jgi:PII-like signaling protein
VSEDRLKLTVYFGERDRVAGGLLADELLDLYDGHELAVSVLLRGSEGFGGLHRMHTDRLLTLSEDLPIVAVAVDRRQRIEAVLEPVLKLSRRGLVTLEQAQLLTGGTEPTQLLAGGTEPLRPPPRLEQECKLTAYVGRHVRVGRLPAYVAITQLLHERGLAGASVLLGVDGTHHGQRRRARLLGRNAQVPAMVIAVGSTERIAATLPELARLDRRPLVTLEKTQVCKRDGTLLAPPRRPPDDDAGDRPLWQKLTVYASQAATREGQPLNLQIVRRLRASGAAGATSLRGVWGFHGDHAPHGDRLLQLRRHVPVLTIAVDTPERIARSFAIVDELTANEGLVTCETVPQAWPQSIGARSAANASR